MIEFLLPLTSLIAAISLVFTLQEKAIKKLAARHKYYGLRFILAGLAASCLVTAFAVPSLLLLLNTALIAGLSIWFNTHFN